MACEQGSPLNSQLLQSQVLALISTIYVLGPDCTSYIPVPASLGKQLPLHSAFLSNFFLILGQILTVHFSTASLCLLACLKEILAKMHSNMDIMHKDLASKM